MRVADVLRRYMEGVDAVYEITLDERTVAPGLVLPDHIAEVRSIRVSELDGSALADDKPYLAVVAFPNDSQLRDAWEVLRGQITDAEGSGTWAFLLADESLLPRYLLQLFLDTSLCILSAERTRNRPYSNVVVARSVSHDDRLQDAWLRVTAASVGVERAAALGRGTPRDAAVRSLLRLRNELLWRDLAAQTSNQQLKRRSAELAESEKERHEQAVKLEYANNAIADVTNRLQTREAALEQEKKRCDELTARIERDAAEIVRMQQHATAELERVAEKAAAEQQRIASGFERELEQQRRNSDATVSSLEQRQSQLVDDLAKLRTALQVERRERGLLDAENKKLHSKVRERTQQADLFKARLQAVNRHVESIQDSNRYKLAQWLWELKYQPATVLALPRKLAGLTRAAVAGPASSESSTPSVPATQSEPSSASPPPARAPTTARPAEEPGQAPTRVETVFTSRASKPESGQDVWVASVLDEMSHACFSPECNLITFTPNDWKQRLEDRLPHFLLVESAWRGNGGSWQYKVGRYNHPDAGGLAELVAWCRERGVPTVFWNKEDPVHFAKFKDSASLFDIVFTTDQNMIQDYRELPGSNIGEVDVLPFAAQPRLHNPTFAGTRKSEPVFAGSYYGNRHHDRRVQQEMLLDAAREAGLIIYDRNHGADDPAFQFPDRFRSHIKGRLPYDELSRVYRQHRVFLNVNSVINSPTMMSRRVFELLACGTAVVSTPSLALETTFADLVPTASTEQEAVGILATLADDEHAWRALARRGVRGVLSRHTYAQRFAKIARAVGVELHTDRRATAVLLVDDSEDLERGLAALRGQSGYVSGVIIGTRQRDGDAFSRRATEALEKMAVTVVVQDAGEEARRHQELARRASSDWLFILDPRRPLAEALLEDLVLSTAFVEASVIGEVIASKAGQGFEHTYVSTIDPRACLVRRELVADRGWRRNPEQASDWLRAMGREGVRVYCARHETGAAMAATENAG